MTQPDFFSLFLHALNSVDVPYMITGAVASTIYGEPRLTQDIDLVLDLDPSGVPRLTAAFPADAVAGEPIQVAPPEYVIVRKLEYRRHGAGEHHLDDVARMLRVSRALIDQATLDSWIARVGVAQEWKEALGRLSRMA